MRKFAIFVLVYTLAVILFGAYVRISGSGAGCGEHWPTCEGQVIPGDLIKNHAKTIEYTHRLTSGLSGVFVLALVIGVFRIKSNKTARRWALLSLLFIITEGLLGASLVLFRWVGMDASIGRGLMMPLHLGNTYLLLTTLALTVKSLYVPTDITLTPNRAIRIGAMLLFVTGMFGAIAALGDTLFPGTRGFVTEGHTYLKLRNVHPFIAVLTIGHILAVATKRREDFSRIRFGRWNICDAVAFLAALQGIIGILNIALSAPAAMQIFHLLGSDILWIAHSAWLFSGTRLEAKTIAARS